MVRTPPTIPELERAFDVLAGDVPDGGPVILGGQELETCRRVVYRELLVASFQAAREHVTMGAAQGPVAAAAAPAATDPAAEYRAPRQGKASRGGAHL